MIEGAPAKFLLIRRRTQQPCTGHSRSKAVANAASGTQDRTKQRPHPFRLLTRLIFILRIFLEDFQTENQHNIKYRFKGRNP